MSEYHKIQSLFKRDHETKKLIEGDWTLPEFEYLAKNDWQFTEKVNGANIRVMYKDNMIDFGGRTNNAQLPATLVSKLNQIFFPILDAFTDTFGEHEVTLYGEGYGPKIQNGSKYREDQSFVLFDIRIGNIWLERSNVEYLAKKFGIEHVPVIGTGNLYDAINIVSERFDSQWGDFEAEGIVARPKVELNTRRGERVITKIKCRDFD
jgi:ATP-dependent RNA circularization protein (DNA/RNA ligase family)